ncbi:hypothetical protein NT6N_26290 [Oceaniferula spumae]|uniref:PA14 domain-containing protein n=1 Tax=Oceaniferula spumae TaxID=2979115 RepID=A0AAT9FNR8_9BACT
MNHLTKIITCLACAVFPLHAAPNIIFFFVDDLGYGDIGCFWQDAKTGTQKFDTPHIDTMAAEGAKLTHHYISASVCAPSRASLMQGRHQGHSDVRNSQFDKALPNNHTMSDMLKRAGYRTIHVGKAGLAGGKVGGLAGTGSQNLAAHPLDRGFDEFFGYLFHSDGHEHFPSNGTTNKSAHIYNGYQQITNASVDLYTTDAWTAYAKNAIITEHNDGDDQPFFLYLAYDTPHFKMQRPAVAYPTGGGLTGGIQWTTATDGAGNIRYASTADGTGTVDGYNHPDNNTSWPTSNQQHVGMIRRLDNSIGDIMKLLKDLGIDDNTICIFSSDNGPHNEGNNPRYFESYANMEGVKRDMWEAGIRVPTVVRWPTHITGATGNPGNIHEISYPSAIWDWMPTFAELADIPAPAWCDGVSLVPTLTGTGTQRDKGYLYFEFNASGSTPNWSEFPNHRGETKGQMQCLRIGDHMGIRTGISSATDDFQIYNSVLDPGQATNLAASMPALQTQMKNLALQARRPAGHAVRPYDSANLAPVSVTTVQGLEYSTYEGDWTYVPEFRDMPPVSNGNTTNLNLSVRSRNIDCGILFTGYVQIPTAGSYTFYLSSDDGANMFVHDAHVIDDDFNHNGSEQSGSVNLGAGMHPIRIYYRHGATGTHALNVSWQGPSISKQSIPDTAFFRFGTPPPEPVANPDNASTSGTTPISIPVLGNDSDDGAPAALSIQSITQPGFGTANISGSNITYTADAGKFGTDQFSYTITDGQFTATATVTVDVQVPSQSSVLLHTDFTGFSTSGTTLSGFSWSSDEGEQDNASTSLLLAGSASGFLTTNPAAAGSGPAVGVAGNVETIGPWNTSFTFTPTQEYDLSSFEVSSYSINSGGNHQGASHSVNWALEISSAGSYFNGNTTEIEPGGNAPQLFTIETNGTRLNADTTYTFKLTVSSTANAGNNIALDSLTLRQSPFPQTPRATWYYTHFGIPSPTSAQWQADTDNDGSNQLAEYAFGGNPHVSDASAVTPTANYNDTSDKLNVTFTRRKAGSHDLTYSVQVSDDLSTWTLPSTEISAISHPILGSDFEQVVVETDGSSPASVRRFIRIKAE